MIFSNLIAVTIFSVVLPTVLSHHAEQTNKYGVISRLHPTLLKPEILYVLLRHRIIDEIERRQAASFRRGTETDEEEKENTEEDAKKYPLNRNQDWVKPYYAPTLSLKKYMQQKAGTKYGLRVQRNVENVQKLPLFVSLMKNRFYGVKRNTENNKNFIEKGSLMSQSQAQVVESLMNLYFNRHRLPFVNPVKYDFPIIRMGRSQNIKNTIPKYRIICHLSCFVQRIYRN